MILADILPAVLYMLIGFPIVWLLGHWALRTIERKRARAAFGGVRAVPTKGKMR